MRNTLNRETRTVQLIRAPLHTGACHMKERLADQLKLREASTGVRESTSATASMTRCAFRSPRVGRSVRSSARLYIVAWSHTKSHWAEAPNARSGPSGA